MDNIRVFLWVGLALLVWINVQTWQVDRAPVVTPASLTDAGRSGDPAPIEAPLPAVPTSPGADPTVPAVPAVPAAGGAEPTLAGGRVRVRTDVLDVELSLAGGDLVSARLPGYPVEKDRPDTPVQLLSADPADWFVFRTGVRAADARPEPTHLVQWRAESDAYVLGPDEQFLDVVLSWSGPGGITAEKVYRFERGHYDVDLEQRLVNGSAEPYRAAPYLQIQRQHNPPDRSMFDVDSYSFTGPVTYNGQRYEKLDVDDLAEEPFEETAVDGWVASIQHHFLGAAVPPRGEPYRYRATVDDGRYVVGAIATELTTVAPGATGVFPAQLFVGPKLQAQLEQTAQGLDLTVDYGLLTLLAQPLFWLLQQVHDFVGNWGLAIILVTLMIKLVFYKLTETSGRSMAKMRKLQPRLKSLQDRYKDDREAMSRALMDLYKREKVNPVAGCLPMVVQIPFFIAFYWVLLESVEMRQAPFMLWINDLSSRDPFFILPLLMGGAMWFQQKLNPAPPDPVQAKVMAFLPVIFTGMFAFFPAGLVLYWLTNSVVSMLQQWRINKVLGAD